MNVGDLVTYKKLLTGGYRTQRELRLIGIIIADRKMYGHRTKVVFWNDGSTEMEDETTIEVLK